MESYDSVVRLEKEGPIALITLNRPDRLNAFNVAMRDQLYEIIMVIRDDPTIEAAVLCGAGKGFCSGADLTEFGTYPPVLKKRQVRLQRDLWEEIRRMTKPIAAALHGFSVGSGLEMAMLCDFRFAAPGTKLALPEAQLGMIPAAGGTQSLPRLVHQGLAMDFALGGQRITAEEGYRMKMISRIVPRDELIQFTVDYMRKVVEHNANSSRVIKSLVTNGLDMSLAEGLAREKVLIAHTWNKHK
ncbi:enoyl-CoA hydratase/isomerase family protein [Peribacillus sp. NPDC097675]|uniref:enoyl-CoA hydratase/isomerase family protein n=1 Tax=Peribacillus sp. NPDC097675 TaxID=3390618 RepID=UPI003CFD63AC